MAMAELAGYALGSVVMYWGMGIAFVLLYVAIALADVLANRLWRKAAGVGGEFPWLEAAGRATARLPWGWVGWLPGLGVQGWYAGYAADLRFSSSNPTLLLCSVRVGGAYFPCCY